MPTRRLGGAPDPAKLTGTRLVEQVASVLDCPASEVQVVWEAALECIRAAVVDGRSVVLMNVGTLDPVTRKARLGYDVGSGEFVKRPRRRSVRFNPSRNLREEL